MNKTSLGTILGAALLATIKSKQGSGASNPAHVELGEMYPYSWKSDKMLNWDMDVKSSLYGKGDLKKAVKSIHPESIRSLSVKEIRSNGLIDFRPFKNLETLSIEGTFSAYPIEFLSGLKHLKTLKIVSHSLLSPPEFYRYPKSFKKLKHLFIEGLLSQGSTFFYGGIVFYNLEFLKIIQVPPAAAQDLHRTTLNRNLSIISELKKLKYLSIAVTNRLTDDQTSFLSGLTNLKELYISAPTIRDIKGIENCNKLEVLITYGCQIYSTNHGTLEDGSWGIISERNDLDLLKDLTKLHTLVLQNSPAGPYDASRGFIFNDGFPNLKILKIEGNQAKLSFSTDSCKKLEHFQGSGGYWSETSGSWGRPNSSRWLSYGFKEIKGLWKLSQLNYIDITVHLFDTRDTSTFIDLISNLFLLKKLETLKIKTKGYLSDSVMLRNGFKCNRLKILELLTPDIFIENLPKEIWKAAATLEKVGLEFKTVGPEIGIKIPTKLIINGKFHLALKNCTIANERNKFPLEQLLESKILIQTNNKYEVLVKETPLKTLKKLFNRKVFISSSLNNRSSYVHINIIGLSLGHPDVCLDVKNKGMSITIEPTDWEGCLKDIEFKIENKNVNRLRLKLEHEYHRGEYHNGLIIPLYRIFNNDVDSNISANVESLSFEGMFPHDFRRLFAVAGRLKIKAGTKTETAMPKLDPLNIAYFHKTLTVISCKNLLITSLGLNLITEKVPVYSSDPGRSGFFRGEPEIEAYYPKLHKFVLSHCISYNGYLTNILNEIGIGCPFITELVIEDSFLPFIPNNLFINSMNKFGPFNRLYKLVIKESHLVSLPPTIVNLPNLRNLDIPKNKIRIIPEFIGDLHLKEFSIYRNPIAQIPTNLIATLLIRYQAAGNTRGHHFGVLGELLRIGGVSAPLSQKNDLREK